MTDNISASGMIMADTKIVRRPDGSFVLDDIYHVPDNEEYAVLFSELSALAEEQPERIVDLPAPSPEEMLEAARAAKLAELANSFARVEKNAVVMSGSGFAIDANERARLDIEGLLATMERDGQATVSFCGADNAFHEVSVDGLKAMRLEVIRHGQELYAAKWRLRSAIESARSMEELHSTKIIFA